jgi:predicted Zn-ribbon and HTH transcriptional regulator
MSEKTIRQNIIALLEELHMDARELSKQVKIREKEVYTHLAHIQKSLKNRKLRLMIEPYYCRLCGFEFADRQRLSPPGRCPQCRRGSIEPAVFTITQQ